MSEFVPVVTEGMMLHVAMGFIYGVALGTCGIGVSSWEFWLLMPMVVIWAVVVSREANGRVA